MIEIVALAVLSVPILPPVSIVDQQKGKKVAAKPVAKPLTKPAPKPAVFDPTQPISIPAPSSRFDEVHVFPGVPAITIDRLMSGGGVANQVARQQHLQGRVMWIDATANIEKINSEPKIVALVKQIKDAGFNTIVLDVKPVSGQTIYPSNYAPRLTEWRKVHVLDPSFDPLKYVCREAKADGLSLLVSLNAFSEGHQLFHVGPGYDQPEHQTVLYEPKVEVQSPHGSTRACLAELNTMPTDDSSLGIFLDLKKLAPLPAGFYGLILGPRNVVVGGFDAVLPTSLPKGGAILVGRGLSADFLKSNSAPKTVLPYITFPNLVPIGQRPNRQYPLMMNPNDPFVQDYELKIARELISNYPIDGLIYDDRLRYAGLDGDFSELSRAQFELYVGHTIQWPSDVYNIKVSTNMVRGILPGRYFDAWLTFRALTIRNYLSRVKSLLRSLRPSALMAVYAGSWFGEYSSLGSNWGSPDFRAGFWSQTNTYRRTGFARLADLIITGCYYPIATVHQAFAENAGLGYNIEAAAALSNRAVRDSAWTYAGIALSDFKDNPDGLLNALSAACATTQGVMVFDLSHDIEPMWPVFAKAFATPLKAPHTNPKALDLVRYLRESLDRQQAPEAPVIIMAGAAGTGQ